MFKAINRYLTAIADQQIIDQRIKELFEIEKVVTIKRAYLGDALIEDLQALTHSEQIKLLKGLVIHSCRQQRECGGSDRCISINRKQAATSY